MQSSEENVYILARRQVTNMKKSFTHHTCKRMYNWVFVFDQEGKRCFCSHCCNWKGMRLWQNLFYILKTFLIGSDTVGHWSGIKPVQISGHPITPSYRALDSSSFWVMKTKQRSHSVWSNAFKIHIMKIRLENCLSLLFIFNLPWMTGEDFRWEQNA